MNDTIRCFYSCDLCGIDDQPIDIPIRKPDEEITAWIEGPVAHALAADHHRRSPRCRPEILRRVKIPLPAGSDRIGTPTRH